MLCLAVDTATPSGSLAVLQDSRILGAVMTSSQETYSSRMFRHLEFLLHELRLELRAFDLLSVAAGPGSFTGLRVGLAAAKAWAEVYQKPIAAVSGLEAVAEQALSPEMFLAPLLDARRGQVYAAIYRRAAGELELVGEETVMTPAEFVAAVQRQVKGEPVAFVTPTLDVIAPVLAASGARGMAVEQVSEVLAPVIARLGFQHFRRGTLVDSLHLDANYIRRSDAELLWKEP
jgi:tRNA threonylcarbamoyladenosine biosynthesis protein TsaB